MATNADLLVALQADPASPTMSETQLSNPIPSHQELLALMSPQLRKDLSELCSVYQVHTAPTAGRDIVRCVINTQLAEWAVAVLDRYGATVDFEEACPPPPSFIEPASLACIIKTLPEEDFKALQEALANQTNNRLRLVEQPELGVSPAADFSRSAFAAWLKTPEGQALVRWQRLLA